MATLSAKNLAKAYKSRQVVRDVSLSVSTGQIVGLLGPNGAGKTTTFYMIVGLVNLDKGKIEIDDNELTHQPMHERARRGIGYLPQEASIFRKLTVHENIMAILQTRKDLNSQQQEEEADALLDEFNINHIRNSTGMSLSAAIQAAGGFASSAKANDIRVSRINKQGKKIQVSVNFDEIGESGNAEADINLLAGDIVFIPERIF